MIKKKKVLVIFIIVVLVMCLIWPAFQIVTPDHYGRAVFISTAARYFEDNKFNVDDLTSIIYFTEDLELFEGDDLPKPTKKRNVVIFNKDYAINTSPDWIVIVLGKDFDSWLNGDWVLTKHLEKKRIRNPRKYITNQEGLVYYYLYLRNSREEY